MFKCLIAQSNPYFGNICQTKPTTDSDLIFLIHFSSTAQLKFLGHKKLRLSRHNPKYLKSFRIHITVIRGFRKTLKIIENIFQIYV